MSATVRIGDVVVDIDRPCDILTELRKAQLIIATGESVSMTRNGEREVRFTAASAARLDKLIETYERLCARTQGRRRRHAGTVVWR